MSIIKANIIYHDTRSQIWITLLIKVSLYHLIISFGIKWTILSSEVTALIQYIRDHLIALQCFKQKKRSEIIMKF